jgi:hypothetical protein
MLLISYCFFIALSLLEFLDTAIAGIFGCWCCWVFFFKLCRMFMIIYCWLLMYLLVNVNFSSANKLLIWGVQKLIYCIACILKLIYCIVSVRLNSCLNSCEEFNGLHSLDIWFSQHSSLPVNHLNNFRLINQETRHEK